MNEIKVNVVVDAKGLACPMPIVKTKKAMNDLEPGKVMLVEATDKGSVADLKAWASNGGHEYIGTVEEGDVLKHYLRKGNCEEKEEKKFDRIIDNEVVKTKIEANENITIVDVREQAEYAFNHITGAISIPFGELEERLSELNKEDDIYVVCRTGNRSDLAAQKLAENGFTKVSNVVPGMAKWEGPTEKSL
jgi:rhodanese-related sulfurtransferase/TusA-related sulfurtransferase